MLRHNPDECWEFYGRQDPYYGVLTQQGYRRADLNEETKTRFFESGQNHIQGVLQTISHHLDKPFHPERALDFGCGAGRMVIPLAEICESVVGVDVSVSMLKEAETNCRARSITNVEFVRSDDQLSNVTGTFDLVHSYIVFQHIPRKRGERIFAKLVDLMREDGVGVLHFPYLRKGPAIRPIDWFRRNVPFLNGLVNVFVLRLPFRYPLIQMNTYDPVTLLSILQERRCHNVYLNFSSYSHSNVDTYGVMIFFQKKTAIPY